MLLGRLRQLDFRAAIVGPEGSGKTSVLEELGHELSKEGFNVLRSRVDSGVGPTKTGGKLPPLLKEITGKDIILLDGVEQIPERVWRGFLRHSASAAGLVITSHQGGRLPTLLSCQTSLELFRNLVLQLLKEERHVKDLPLSEIFERREGNVRLALLDLYDLFAHQG